MPKGDKLRRRMADRTTPEERCTWHDDAPSARERSLTLRAPLAAPREDEGALPRRRATRARSHSMGLLALASITHPSKR